MVDQATEPYTARSREHQEYTGDDPRREHRFRLKVSIERDGEPDGEVDYRDPESIQQQLQERLTVRLMEIQVALLSLLHAPPGGLPMLAHTGACTRQLHACHQRS